MCFLFQDSRTRARDTHSCLVLWVQVGVVGLKPGRNMSDLPTYDLYRFRRIFKFMIPSLPSSPWATEATFAIPFPVRTIHLPFKLIQLNSCPQIFNYLVVEFEFESAFRDLPEYTIKGSIITRNRIKHYYFKVGCRLILFQSFSLSFS